MAVIDMKKRENRREVVIEAARALIQETGDLGFSMRSLAERAGVSIATPYKWFGSKQSILIAVLDADLESYQRELSALRADEIDVLFQAGRLLADMLAREPNFYRNVLHAVARGGLEFRTMVNGPRYLIWKRMLRQATEAGLLEDDVDPDAFAIASGQLLASNVLEWAQRTLSLEEMTVRNEYGLALSLLAIATDRSRADLKQRMRSAESRLQRFWREMLIERLRTGELDESTRELLMDQLAHLNLGPESSRGAG